MVKSSSRSPQKISHWLGLGHTYTPDQLLAKGNSIALIVLEQSQLILRAGQIATPENCKKKEMAATEQTIDEAITAL